MRLGREEGREIPLDAAGRKISSERNCYRSLVVSPFCFLLLMIVYGEHAASSF